MGLLFDPDAFSKIPPNEVKRLMRKIDWLWVNRMLVTHFPLSQNLSGFFKRRLGKYRILYSYDSASDNMIIHLVGLRDTIYKNASESDFRSL